MKLLSRVWLFATLWTVDYLAPLSVEFSRLGHWSGLPFPSPGDLPNPGSPALPADSLTYEPRGKPKSNQYNVLIALVKNWTHRSRKENSQFGNKPMQMWPIYFWHRYKAIQWRKVSASTNGARTIGHPYAERMDLDQIVTPYINSYPILKCKMKNDKPLRKHRRRKSLSS